MDELNLNDPEELNDAELARLEELVRELTDDDLRTPPPPPISIWEGIQTNLSDDATVSELSSVLHAEETTAPNFSNRSLSQRRSAGRNRWWIAAAATVVLVVGGISVVLQASSNDKEDRIARSSISNGSRSVPSAGGAAKRISDAQLQWDASSFDPAGEGAAAKATLFKKKGQYSIKLSEAEFPELANLSADLELWVIEADADGAPQSITPVSIIDPQHPGTYVLPKGIDPNTFNVVDISIEPRDGDDAHSGRSILRGQFVL